MTGAVAACLTGAGLAAGPVGSVASSAAVAGRFHSGRRVGNCPESLATWRVCGTSGEMTSAVAGLLGGVPQTTGDGTEVVTSSASVRVVLAGAPAVATELRLWGTKGLEHHCDGVLFLSPASRRGTPCGCPASPAGRAELARSLRAPQPDTTVTFRLADAYGLGEFVFSSPSQLLADDTPGIRERLGEIGGETLAELAIELVTVALGGVEVSFRKTTLTVIGPWG
ncbi:hypothetical protein GCM10020229_80150 [Kitasatospora albolonga]|uniref:recombination directionality factor n=1 Tax=Kitasatospora albolonga TaxID=68173 RepID=UPI0033703356